MAQKEQKTHIKRIKKDILAVEIGTADLKMALFRTRGDKRELVDITASDITRSLEDGIVQKLKDEFARNPGAKSAEVVNVIPSSFAIFKNIEIPSTDEKEIKDIIDLQAGRHTPYSRDEIIIDYMDLGTAHDCYTKVLLVIVKRDIVTKRYEMISAAGLKAERAALSAEGVSRQFFETQQKAAGNAKPVAIVNVERTSSDFIIEQSGNSLYIRSIPAGSINAEANPEAARTKFMEEIKRSLESYQSENIEAMPEKIYITGATDWLEGTQDRIKRLINIECVMMPQLVMLSMADNKMLKESIKKGFSVMSVASIPAVLEDLKLNIIPEDIKMRKALKGRAHEMAKIAAFAMISLIVFCSILLMHVVFNRLYLERLRSKYTSQVQEAEKLKQIAQKNYTVESFLNKKGQSLGILTELYNALPPAIYLNSMNLKEDRTMSFTGTADTMSSVFSLVTSLENNPYFSGVKVESTRSRRVENKEVADFSLTLTLEKDV